MKESQECAVLLVEDDPVTATMMEDLLEDAGCRLVGVAVSGEEAVAMTAEHRPDVVLMDVQLDGMDGLEATRRIQAETPTAVVVLSAFDVPEFIDRASEAGVGAYLLKPARAGEIRRAVALSRARHRDMMELRRLNDELREALQRIRTLQGMLPICAGCKKIRDDAGYWQHVEVYISEHSEAEFSHGLCPDCAGKFYEDMPELLDDGSK